MADIHSLLDDTTIDDSTPLSQIAVLSKCVHRDGKSCLRFKDAKLDCTISRADAGVDFASNTVYSVTRTMLTLYRTKVDVDNRILWPDSKLTVGDITKLSPRLYLACFNSMFGIPGKRDGVAKKLLDEPLLPFFKDKIDLNKSVLNMGACYMPMWSFMKGDLASELKVGSCDEVTGYKYRNKTSRIEITFQKLKS